MLLMNVFLSMCLCALRMESVPLLPGLAVKYTILAPKQMHRQTVLQLK